MSLPHFLGGKYEYTDSINSSGVNSSSLCQSESPVSTSSSNQSCSGEQGGAQQGVYPLLLMGQLLLGIGAVPIQPFGISYIDDHASRKNSPLYLGTSRKHRFNSVLWLFWVLDRLLFFYDFLSIF
ncbi:solute carrier organic anion transporter family member 2B1-like, partial [Notothenia coriiceps]|uniref:Solute carrier organic anion transporter family member 2B1-like n=1 Tax=Notothenia coriiceps TaxID=8208 RepID=A0A6I9P6F2_9TELE